MASIARKQFSITDAIALSPEGSQSAQANLLCGAPEEGEGQMLGEWRGGHGGGFRDWK